MQATISPDTIALIEEWTEVREGGIAPLHDALDADKLAVLVQDMNEAGWRGAPLVVDDDQAVTGSHRYWAALETGTEIPRIDISDLCDLFDIDWIAHVEAFDDWIDRYIHIADRFPVEVRDYLGFDIH